MTKQRGRMGLLIVGLALAGCAAGGVQPESGAVQQHPTAADREAFLAQMDERLFKAWLEADRSAWVQSTYITPDTDWLAARATERRMAVVRALFDESRPFLGEDLSPEAARKLSLLRLFLSAPGPADPVARRELADIQSGLVSTYGTGQYCPAANECLNLGQMSQRMAQSRDYDELLDLWVGWRKISVPMREPYGRFVTLANRGARELGFADVGEMWRSGYDMTPAELAQEAKRLWRQVQPLYEALHCYVRGRLAKKYGTAKVPPDGLIPAHLLGNMWAQDWGNIYDLVVPYPEAESVDVTSGLKKKGWGAQQMVESAESFFVSLGLPALPDTFWQRSLLTKPRDRDVVCHASAWEMGGQGDVRIKMCIEPTEEDFFTIHHELGHVYYYLHYAGESPLFQNGANDGFHEGIGDTLVLSMTPDYLAAIGLVPEANASTSAEINALLKRALDKVAFLPFGLMIDRWRWEVFSGAVPEKKRNQRWWELRESLQGIAPPVVRSEADFDPGAKYHIPNNTPYLRYFLADILQFQFHRALCRAAGHEGPLHTCSIAGSKEAGGRLAAMLSLGAKKPWPEALRVLSGEEQMDASAMLEYFAPLADFFDQQNAGQTCGWAVPSAKATNP